MSAAIAWKAIAIFIVISIGLLLFVSPAFAGEINDSSPAVEWQYTYGGPGSDVGYSAAPAADGGYLVLGTTRSYGNGNYDAWLLKLDAKGREQWNRTYGGAGGDWLYDILPTADGNYVMGGATGSSGNGGFDVWLVKVDGNGNVLWSKTYGGPNADAGFNVAVTGDGGYAITGYWGVSSGDSDFVIIRTDADGNSLWDRMYKNGVQDWSKAIIATSDGGFAIGGWTKSTSGSKVQAYLMKTDGNGTRQWDGIFGGVSGDTYGYGVVETNDGGYIVGGYTSDGEYGGIDIYGAKVNNNGHRLWEKTVGLSKDDYGFNAVPIADGLVFGGYSSSFDPTLWKLYLVKTTNDGNIVSYQSYGPEKTSVKGILSLRTADNGYLFVGNTNEYGSGKDDVFVLKLAGTPALPAPAPEDIVAKAAVPVAAVAAGTGLSFLALFMGRIFDYLSALAGKAIDAVNEILRAMTRAPLFGALYKLANGYFQTYVKGMIFGRINKIKIAVATERAPFLAVLSSTELLIVIISAVLLGVAYIIAKKLNIVQLDTLVIYIVIAGLVTSLHDLTHRYYAHKYKAVAEYKFWWFGTAVMFLTALGMGVTYAVPARTIINKAGNMGVKEQAIVFLSGPLVSGLLAFAFLLLVPFGGIFRTIGLLGVSMNLLSAVYSLTPFQPMDGNKVYRWKKALWAVTFVPFLLLYLWITIFVQ